ncbi:MAG: hypothetical protein KME13_22905 [Myxacorys californica WJT36-NPBG1]|jgi:hypothetical protein|nr:hypothetical protein [Myxacorys californica WJT36-NPBG1]
MSQSRVVIRSKDIPMVERIMQTTGVDSASDVISLLVSRYGDALLTWWTSDVHPCRFPVEVRMPDLEPDFPHDPGVGLGAIDL